MDSYRKQLILLYFKTSGRDYNLSELIQLFGIQQNQMDLILQELKSDGYISINNYEIAITDKGLSNLNENNIANNANSDIKYHFNNINVENLKPLDEPYVPKNF